MTTNGFTLWLAPFWFLFINNLICELHPPKGWSSLAEIIWKSGILIM